MRRTLTHALIVAVAAVAALHAASFKSVWKAPDAGTVGFAGKKVAALVITKDTPLRMSAEEALARQLVALGIQGVAAYRVLPQDLQDKDKARAWFEKTGVEGVVAMRPISAETVKSYQPSMWSSGYYTSLWGYYGYTWTAVYSPASVRQDTTLTVETLVFSVPRDKLLWAALSETTNPEGMDAFMKDLVGKAVKEMKKAGLTAPRK
ncbi:MAG: hypothetical protein H6Q10_1187 [Acidobacteria bacterium]|nr:hypothetical protein [Acidobacteriota bacterium]